MKVQILSSVAVALCLITGGLARAYDRPVKKPAIVLAAFGTTEPEALQAIFNLKGRVEKAFPDHDVCLAFTSNKVRSVWRERSGSQEFRLEHPEVPAEVFQVKSVLATLGDLQETGSGVVLVQSLHITDGEEYKDLAGLVGALAGIKTRQRSLSPFPWIGVGEPALGVGDGRDAYLARAAGALEPLWRRAEAEGRALVLMGHGNEHLNQEVFAKLESELRKRYGSEIYIGTVEAPPFPGDIAAELDKLAKKPAGVLLAPLMLVAGDHARNDMAGEEEDSWKNIFANAGYEVECVLTGLGSLNAWADIYVEHLRALESRVLAERKAKGE